MLITVRQLRRLIREALREEADVPGRWRASNGEPVDSKDLERLGYGGFPSPFEEGDLDESESDDLDQGELDQGHEPSSKLYQMNHQGDGEDYDQMGKPIR